MAYGVNAPFGLRPYGHLIGGADDIRTNSNYAIDVVTATTLNKGDPVIYAPVVADSAPGLYYQGGRSVITRYNATPTIAAGGTPTTFAGTNTAILGVFQGCEYWINGTYYNQEYWVAGTPATSSVKAYVIDDPNVIWDVQLGTWFGSDANNVGGGIGTAFLLPPTMQRQVVGWPAAYGGQGAANPQVGNSALIGTNVMLMTGRGPLGAVAGGTNTLTTITTWNGAQAVVAGYNDNPLIANYGTGTSPSNPLGVSTYYACPSLAGTTANPSVANGANEYARTAAGNASFKVLGFTPNPRNVPATYGIPGNVATPGNYFNTPFLNVIGVINNHVFKASTQSVVPG